MNPMRLLTIPVFILLLYSCKSRNPAPAVRMQDTAKIVAKDSAIGDTDEAGYPTKYVTAAQLDLPDQTVKLVSRYAVVNGQVDLEAHYDAISNYFVHIDKKTGKGDTIEAQFDNDDIAGSVYVIRNMTDSFHLPYLIVQVVTQGDDIYYNNSFLGFKDGQFKVLFSIGMDTREDGIRLHREGSKLVGFTSGRDDVVYNVEEDYPIEVDLNTFDVNTTEPDKQYIGWYTKATESFRAHRVIDGRVDSSLVTVKAGTELTVDTLYRPSGKVRLRLADSVIVEIKAETAKKKLQENAAG
jgi:hypothetical protein